MYRKAVCLWTAIALAMGCVVVAELAVAQETPKWFVLRQPTTGDCRTALLITMDGGYVSGTSLKAGGPYDTETEAEAQRKVLQERSVCAKS